MIRVSAPSRLHFGPFSLPTTNEQPARTFGGAGMMIERPGPVVSVERASSWSAEGPLADRALASARQVNSDQPCRIVVEQAPPDHVGLGTGTQLGLAVTRAVCIAAGHGERDAPALARLAGRGQRSALGIHGFAQGGFLVEAGKRSAGTIAPLVARMAVPAAWRVVLVIPRDLRGEHGAREADAFRRLSRGEPDARRTDEQCRLVLLGMLPALAEGDIDAFGESLYEFNRRAGEMFRPWQGDVYAHPRIARLVEAVRSSGLARGAGQSSWGPAVFAVVRSEQAGELCDWLTRRSGCGTDEIVVTPAANSGAQVAG
jgi:beta-RFAP synthase